MIRTVQREEWSTVQSTLSANELSITTWNTLRRECRLKGKYWVPEIVKDWTFRKDLIMQMMIEIDSDLFLFEEIELFYIEEDFMMFWDDLGYSFVSAAAKNDKEKKAHGHTKPTICYRREKLILEWSAPRSRTVAASFRVVGTDEIIYVGAGHLQGGGGNNSYTRYCQAVSLIKVMYAQIEETQDDQNVHIVIGGDFNAYVDEPVYRLMLGKDMDDEDVLVEKYGIAKPNPEKMNYINPVPLIDISMELGIEKPFFTFKWGSLEDASYSFIDYLFHSGNMSLVRYRDPLTADQKELIMEGVGLPCEWHPSDHLPVTVVFQFGNK